MFRVLPNGAQGIPEYPAENQSSDSQTTERIETEDADPENLWERNEITLSMIALNVDSVRAKETGNAEEMSHEDRHLLMHSVIKHFSVRELADMAQYFHALLTTHDPVLGLELSQHMESAAGYQLAKVAFDRIFADPN